MEIIGTIKWVGQPKNGVSSQGNNWQSVEFSVEEQGSSQYPASYVLSVFNKPELMSMLQVGVVFKFKFDGKAHEHNGRWYNNLHCWAIEAVQVYGAQPAYAPQAQPAYAPQPQLPYGAQPQAPAYGAQPAAPQYAPQPQTQQGPLPFPPSNGDQPF